MTADPKEVMLEDPAIFKERYGSVEDFLKDGSFTVTNHPKRSWFARVYEKGGKIRVE